MKLVTFRAHDDPAPRLGVLVDDERIVLDAQATHILTAGTVEPSLVSMQTLIESGQAGLDLLRHLAARDGVRIPLPNVALLAPLPCPAQIRDCLGFREHMERAIAGRLEAAGQAVMTPTQKLRLELFDRRPHWYKANRFAVCGPEAVVMWPSYSKQMDYEHELALVIGRRCIDVDSSTFPGCVFGYTIFNDFSARDVQNDEMAMLGPNKSKDFDCANAFGPCIVTADSFDPADVEMVSRINGQVQNVNRSSTMTWDFEALVAAVSRGETLHPGEIICSGTEGGGSGLETGRMLASGDVIELEIGGIGTLRNRVLASATHASLEDRSSYQ